MGVPVNLERKKDAKAIHIQVGLDILCSPGDANLLLFEVPTWLNGFRERIEERIGKADHKKWRCLTTCKVREEDHGVELTSKDWDGVFSHLGIGRKRDVFDGE